MTALKVNGVTSAVTAPPDTALLWVLRDELGLPAAKYGCGLDQCGACTVLVDGRRVAACQTTVGDVGSREVTTLEALANTEEGKRVVEALAQASAGQCGFCLPGIAVTLIDLVGRGEPMTRAEIAHALDPHLCRCGSQPRILRVASDLLAHV